MKLKITSLLLCASMIGFYACSNENEEGQDIIQSSSLRIKTDIATRSVIESTTFASGDQIGVFVFDANRTNIRATYNNAKWTLENAIALTETPSLVYACYPYTSDCNGEMVKVNIAPDAIVTGQADYLYGASVKEVNATNPDAFIHFNHALARITLSIQRSADDAGYGVLSNVCLRNAGSNTAISTSGWMDIRTGEISNKTAGSISLDVDYTLSSETVQNVNILVIPTEMKTEGMVELELTIDGSQYIVKMPTATWEAGGQYTYPVIINRKDAVINIPKEVTYEVNGVKFSMIYVEAGTFMMGSMENSPIHQVILTNDYYIGKTEVTQELWQAVLGTNPSFYSGINLPVEDINWDDCQMFIGKLNSITENHFRLPTEAEWEYAARGGKYSKDYLYSGSNNINEVAWSKNNGDKKTHAVGMLQPNELGLYDMSGNVCEWCIDWFGEYNGDVQTNPTGPTEGKYRMLRGGSYSPYSETTSCLSTARAFVDQDSRYRDRGLRLVVLPIQTIE